MEAVSNASLLALPWIEAGGDDGGCVQERPCSLLYLLFTKTIIKQFADTEGAWSKGAHQWSALRGSRRAQATPSWAAR